MLLITQQLDLRDSVEIFDVDGAQLIPIDIPKNELYSKFQSVVVVFKSDQRPRTFLNQEKGILVRYSAVRKGKALAEYEGTKVAVWVEPKNSSGS